MNTTHLWNSQTYQLEKEAVLLARDTADVWSFQTFAKPATQLQRSGCEEMCSEYPDDDGECLEICEGEFAEMEDFAKPDQGPSDDCKKTCEEFGNSSNNCLAACNTCKLKTQNMSKDEMFGCIDEEMRGESDEKQSDEKQSDEQQQRDEYILKMIQKQHRAAVEQQQHAPVEQQGNTGFDNLANLPR